MRCGWAAQGKYPPNKNGMDLSEKDAVHVLDAERRSFQAREMTTWMTADVSFNPVPRTLLDVSPAEAMGLPLKR